MGRSGPLPMPDNVRELRGLPPSSKPRVKAPAARPVPPTWLDREGRQEWGRIIGDLDALGILARIDRGVLAAYCDAWSTFTRARRELNRKGLVVEGDKGRTVKNPVWQVYRESAGLVSRMALELGLTPAARLRMTLPGKPDDPSDDDGVID